MPPVGFEPTISAGERTQTYALERAATGNGAILIYRCKREGGGGLWKRSIGVVSDEK